MTQENSRPFREEETAAIDTFRIPAQTNAIADSGDILERALELLHDGISVVPVRAGTSKAPFGPWKKYQQRLPTEQEVRDWFTNPGYGLGVVTGAVSGNLEMTEIEGRALKDLGAVRELAEASGLLDVWDYATTGWREVSPSGGIHWFYRLDGTVAANHKIASRPANSDELADAPMDKTKVLAETRGEGGFVVIAPTPGEFHVAGRPWVRVLGGELRTLNPEQRSTLHALLATMGSEKEPPAGGPATRPTVFGQSQSGGGFAGTTPGDHFEAQTSWHKILTPAGWTPLYTNGRTTYWRRPGKTDPGFSATTGRVEDRDRLWVFSTSTDFPDNEPITKFHAYSILQHQGDHAAAATELRRQGFGRQDVPSSRGAAPKAAGEATEPQRTVTLTSAASIKPRPVFWLWDGRLALGTLGLLAGRQGLGKSTLAYWLAARVTRGDLDGEFRGNPKSVLICATEDSWEHTIVPRLIAAGADLERIYRVEVVTADNIHVGLALPRDNHAVERAATEKDAALMLLDPLISRLGDLDTHRDSEVRQALEPLVGVATRSNMAVLGLIHHNKSGSADPLQSVMGSTAFSAVARSVHTVIPDPDDDTGGQRLFGTPKNNLGRTDLPTLAFAVASHAVPTEQGTAWTGAIAWAGEHPGSITDAMRQSRDGEGNDRSAAKEAADWLEDFLTMEGPEVESAIAKRKARDAGHSESAVHRARKKLGVIDRSSGYPRTTKWSLPVKPSVVSQSWQSARGDETTTTTETTEEMPTQSLQSSQSLQDSIGLPQLLAPLVDSEPLFSRPACTQHPVTPRPDFCATCKEVSHRG